MHIPYIFYITLVSIRILPLQPGSKALALDHPRLVRRVAGVQPDQIHITYWRQDEATISWITGEAQMGPQVCTLPPCP